MILLATLNNKKKSLIESKQAPQNMEEIREKFGDVLKFEETDRKRLIDPQEAMRKFLTSVKNDN